MECLLLYLDDLDDLFGVVGLLWEDVRNGIALLISALLVILVSAGAFLLAWSYPALALATSTLLFIVLLYRSAASPALKSPA